VSGTSSASQDERQGPSTPLRILAFCDYYGPASTGGAERVAREIYRRLALRGATIDVVTALRGAAYEDEGVAVWPVRAFDLSPVLGAQLAVGPAIRRTGLRAGKRLRPHVVSAQTVHFHGSLVASAIARKLRIPLVTTAHVADLSHLHGTTRWLGELHERSVGRTILRRSDHVVAVSQAVAAHAQDRGAPAEAITVIPNGVDRSRFPPTVPANAEPPMLLFVGRLIGNKGPDLLLRAARDLWSSGANFELVYVGDGPMRQQLQREVEADNLPASFPGPTDDVASWLRRASVVVRPSYTEGMPLTILEAMSAQRAVVASNIPANAELIEDGKNGLLHTPGDRTDLALRLRLLLEDPALRRRLATAGTAVAEDHTWDAAAESYEAVLRRAVARNGAPTG
jgi:glycosyltransferase involved in cell wall biosynthesis